MRFTLRCKQCGAVCTNARGREDDETNSAEVSNETDLDWNDRHVGSCEHEEYDIIDSKYEDMD